MAQNAWINVTVNANAVKFPERNLIVHTIARGGSASGDLTLSFDKAKFTTRTVLRSAVDQILKVLEGGSEILNQ